MLVTITANAQSYTYDVNSDGIINVSDISCLVNKILGENNPGEETNVLPLQLSSRKLNLVKGFSEVVGITSGSGNYMVFSCDEAVAKVSLSGSSITVSAISGGNTFITVTDTKSGQAATIKVIVDADASPCFLNCPDNNHPHVIDLGLPSGTKWACCNVGADAPEVFGGYYAWGETAEKTTYNWSNYSHCEGSEETCLYLGDIAGTEYDVAHVKWGSKWVMPNYDQFSEMYHNCSYEWSACNGVWGLTFTGPNGASIFMPAGGERRDGSLEKVGIRGLYRLSKQDHISRKNRAFGFHFAWSVQEAGAFSNLCYGQSVRPIYVGNTYNSFVLSKNDLEIYDGENSTVGITSGSGSYRVRSSNSNVATASLSGATITVKGVSAGSAVVTVTDTKTGNSLEMSVTVVIKPECYSSCPDDMHPHLIDLGLPSGTKWACCNVGANMPDACGGLYGWGETEKLGWDTYAFYDSLSGKYADIGSEIAGTKYDVAHEQLGGPWRMPTAEQIQELVDNCIFEWCPSENGVQGGWFMGPNGSIFLPATFNPVGDDPDVPEFLMEGYYRSSTLNSKESAPGLFFYAEDANITDCYRSDKLPVRPVVKY